MRPLASSPLKQWRLLESIPHRHPSSSTTSLRFIRKPTQFRPQRRAYSTDDQTVAVRTGRRRLGWGQRFMWGFAIVALYKGIGWYLHEVVGLTVEVSMEQKEIPEDEDDDEEEDALFLPYHWPVKLDKAYYSGSDPEWQEFVRFAQDHENQSKSRDAIANEVASLVSKHPGLRKRLGSDIRAPQHWLDCSFPDGPPVEYARRGLLLTGDWPDSTQIMSQADYNELRHLLWPDAWFMAARKSIQYFLSLQLIQVKKMMDISLSQREQMRLTAFQGYSAAMDRREQSMKKAMKEAKARDQEVDNNLKSKNVGRDSSVRDQHQPSNSTSSVRKADDSLNSSVPSETPSQGLSLQNILSLVRTRGGATDEPISLPRPPHSIFASQHVFRTEFIHRFMQYNDFVRPRGSFMISGQVEVIGSLGRAKIMVESCWDSKEMKPFWTRLVRLEGYWPHKQSPRGGA